MSYYVFNIAGGHMNFLQLDDAVDEAQDFMNEPYVHGNKGIRPVFDGVLGEYGQSYDELVAQVEEDRR
jgi:hypothetical protein